MSSLTKIRSTSQQKQNKQAKKVSSVMAVKMDTTEAGKEVEIKNNRGKEILEDHLSSLSPSLPTKVGFVDCLLRQSQKIHLAPLKRNFRKLQPDVPNINVTGL